MRNSLVFAMFSLIYTAAFPQEDWRLKNVDEMFLFARSKAFEGHRSEAREMLSYILEKSPDYSDARILLARTYAWDDDYNHARKELQTVLRQSPYNLDAIQAAADVEIWSDKDDAALDILQNGLRKYPNDEDLLYKKASVLNSLNRQDDALITLNNLLTVNPGHDKGASLLRSIKLARMRYTAALSYGLDLFSRNFDPAHYTSVQLGRTDSWGSIIGRINYANRFGTNGMQWEIDAYPKIANGIYAYLNYGFSNADLFPKHRAGAELYSKLPHSFEISAGARYLFFDPVTRVTIFTGSLGWYVGNYWLSLRPYITPDKTTGTSVSGSVTARRYFSDPETYIGISAGLGFSADLRKIQDAFGFSTDQIYLLKAQRGGIALQKLISSTFIFTAAADVARQELSFETGQYVIIASFAIGLKKKF